MSQFSYNLAPASLSWYFLKQSLFILRETTPEILGPWEELEFTAMGTILLMSINFLHLLQQILSLSFPTELKNRFLAILYVHRFRLSGSSCNFLWFIPMKPPSLLLVFTPVFIHTILSFFMLSILVYPKSINFYGINFCVTNFCGSRAKLEIVLRNSFLRS